MPLTFHWFISVALFAAVMLFTPGPNNILLANCGALHGYKKTLPIILGAMFGPLSVLLLLATGGALLLKIAIVHNSLRLICFLYVLYLAYKIAMAKPPSDKGRQKILSFWHVFALQWVNPKVWIQYVMVVSLYTNAHYHYTTTILTVAAIFFTISIFSGSVWALLGKTIARYLKSSVHYKIFNVIMALLLLAAVLPDLFRQVI